MLNQIPDNYKKAAILKQDFAFYRGYAGIYQEIGYSSKRTAGINYDSDKKRYYLRFVAAGHLVSFFAPALVGTKDSFVVELLGGGIIRQTQDNRFTYEFSKT